MPAKLQPLSGQVLVITGASSGIGLALARRAARSGAAVVLNSRDDAVLLQVCERINAAGGRAHAVSGDLADPEEAAKLARAAVARFGRFDAWINDGGGVAGDSEPQQRKTYLGVVNATLEAAGLLRAQDGGGDIINVVTPGASAAAIKGFNDALRAELRRDRSDVHLTLVRGGEDQSPEVIAGAALRHVRPRAADRGAVRKPGVGKPVAGLALGLGALALAGTAAWFGRGLLGRAARPVLARAVTPFLVRAALRRPVAAAGLAARHPKAAARLFKAAS